MVAALMVRLTGATVALILLLAVWIGIAMFAFIVVKSGDRPLPVPPQQLDSDEDRE